ncbi:isotrichodermin C-15 hydroxylase [Mytilinidion resinicola]|uniref:Isotrichodermin C-15 hydroxylase n=1 Tax=Mytilinidion resinicola TaxID=574789 RepID=A0A6A6YJF2_9PEZI|nr:isotrichodermin C-15 hydroxylase [Mytilinidion resinicola]KAF2808085.1 isotrichodermin C-15 hydroxylase [Mytilinidion resinicola]
MDAPVSGSALYSPQGLATILGTILLIIPSYFLCTAIYNIYFHPLSHIPGEKLAAATWAPYIYHLLSGDQVKWVQKLHTKYGEAVRLSPTEVSFISGETAWQDVYGFRTGKNKTPPYLKDSAFYAAYPNGYPSIVGAGEELHQRLRRNFAHAFSDKALREQEPLIQGYVDLFINRLEEEMVNGATDILKWYNCFTFDIIADLTFGEPLGCLRDRGYQPLVNLTFFLAKGLGLSSTIRRFPHLQSIARRMLPKDVLAKQLDFITRVFGLVRVRMARETDRPDFLTQVIQNQEAGRTPLATGEIESSMAVFMVAGSETTATMLSGTTWLLLQHPAVLETMVREIRGRFKSASEITAEAVSKLEYMIAVCAEGLRFYPPVPTGFPRVVPKGGDRISGHWVPEGSSVYVSQYPANHSARNFVDPDSFVPERWLGDERYAADKKAVYNPFSFGPRNCLGKQLAYAEMRLIMARVFWTFDLELVEKETNWLDQKVFSLWEKPPLMVKLTPVVRD